MKIKNRVSIRSLTTFCVALACVLAAATAQADLFSSATVAEADSVSKVDSDILKRRVVKVNFGEIARLTRVGARLPINLFDDVSLNGTVAKVEDRGAKNYTLSGQLDGDEVSNFTLSVYDDVVAMNVRTAKDFYQVRSVRNGLHEIFQMADHAFGGCDVKPEHYVAAPVAAESDLPQAEGDDGNTVDVMVVYTPAARAAAGSVNAITAQINLAVTEANTAYTQSQINMQIRLVYAGEVSYVESGGFSPALTAVTSTTDGIMDEVHTLRNTYGADLVSLWINDNSSCGLAWVMQTLSGGFAANGFSVCYWGPGCATGYYSFAHEMAHNAGCTHDRENSGGQGLYSYSYGWRFNGTNGAQYRTVMAYAPGTRVQRFSNPNVSYLGTPTGVATGQVNESYNALALNNSKLTVANFRQAAVSTNTPPSIGIQPEPQSVSIGGTATFSVAATGTPTLYYIWRREGTNVNGVSTSSSYTINNVQSNHVGGYSVVVSNAFGSVTSSVVALTISTQPSLGEAVDNIGFSWITYGNASWFGETTNSHDSADSATSGTITDDEFTILETPIIGPGTLSFWWKVSSEATYDWLDVFLDQSFLDPFGLTGEVNWTPRTFSIPEGPHTLSFQYFKDESFLDGQDRGWVDQISYIGISSFEPSSLGKTNGLFKLTFNGLPGASYTLQTSTNLTSWTPVTNVLLNSLEGQLFIDVGSSNLNSRFYRMVSP